MIEFSNYINENSAPGNIINIIFNILFKIIRMLKLFSRNDSSKVVVISLNKLGDTVFTIPAIKAIRNKYDEPPVVVCYAESKLIYQLAFDDLQYIILDKDDFYFDGRVSKIANRKRISELKAGIIIDITASIKSASLIFNSSAREIIGSNDKYFSSLYTEYIPVRKLPHLVDKYLDITNKICSVSNEFEPKESITTTKEDSYILVHPFAGWKAKEWGFDRSIELAQSLLKVYNCKIIIPAKAVNEKMLINLNSLNIPYIITQGLDELIDVIKECFAVIGNDSGPIYIATLLGKATFTIYGPTNPLYSLPGGDRHDYIRKNIKCLPEINKQYCNTDAGRRCSYFECMEQLSVEEVLRKVDLFLEKTGVQKDLSINSFINIQD